MIIKGFKAFNLDQTNNHGKIFEEGKIYTTKRNVQFFISGYHICQHLPHVYSYYHPVEEVKVASVVGMGKYHYIDYDDYRDIYDMYAFEKIYIEHFLNRKEIMDIVYQEIPQNQKIFLYYATLSKEEKEFFLTNFYRDIDLMRTLLYTQYNMKDIYTKNYEEVNKLVRKCSNG